MGVCGTKEQGETRNDVEENGQLQAKPEAEPAPKPAPAQAKKATPAPAEKEEPQEKLTDDDKFLIKVLRKVPLLSSLNQKDLLDIRRSVELGKYQKGSYIFRQGEKGNGFFILTSGKVAVESKVKDEVQQVAVLGAGDYFGEAALRNERPRMASIKCIETTACFFMDKTKFNTLGLGKKLRFAKRAAVSAEKGGQQPVAEPANAVKKKSEEQTKLIWNAVRENLLFKRLTTDMMTKVIAEMYQIKVTAEKRLIEQGSSGNHVYVVEKGKFQISIRSKDGKEKTVAKLGPGMVFGELALMYNAPRAASCTAETDAVLWVIDRYKFRSIIANLSSDEQQSNVKFLGKVKLLAPLNRQERSKVAEALEEVEFPEGHVLMKQGDVGDEMYILKKGECVCYKDDKEVMRYKEGDYFGELALMNDAAKCKRAATIKASTKVKVMKLAKAVVQGLLGPVEHIMKEHDYEEEQKEKKAKEVAAAEVNKTTFKKYEGKLSDLKHYEVLGKGSFGRVSLVEDRKKNMTYALKAVSICQIKQTGQEEHIMSEKNVLAMMDHPLIVRLYGTFTDDKFLYFLLEPCLGGELFTVLRSRTFFSEEISKFYAASVVSMFKYMHERDVIYRDLKPENLLLDSHGYLKMTDFGFAKKLVGVTYTLCGTPDYLAPEIVEGKGHGKGVDWWCLGILIYEMLASYPPFFDENPMKTYSKITRCKVDIPGHFSKEASSIINKLLEKRASKRLGVIKGGARTIETHPWFSEKKNGKPAFNFAKLYSRDLTAPIPVEIRNKLDVGNFDYFEEDGEEEILPYTGDRSWFADF